MPGPAEHYDVIVIGGGHAGAEAAWAAANLLRAEHAEARGSRGRVALLTMDAAKIGAMSCNPAIGGLAKGQMVREVDALGGLMGRAIDATGIQFRVLNASKGPAVRGPRAQADKYAYAREVQRLLRTRPNLDILEGEVEELIVEDGRCVGVIWKGTQARRHEGTKQVTPAAAASAAAPFLSCFPLRASVPPCLRASPPPCLRASAVVLTTGTFMRGLMHTGPTKTHGGRVGEAPAVGISGSLQRLGFELGRLKTGTPPRLAAGTIDFAGLELQPGDDHPTPFSDLTDPAAFPVLPQRPCHLTHTSAAAHDRIRANLHRAPMYDGSITADCGPRYCPSIEDKVVRFADRASHHVFLEPESLETDEVYCNGISTSLPADVQDFVVAALPGCENARILRYGYAVEYDMVWPHQIDATTMTKRVAGLFLAGQINGTSGYEEAAGQGLVAGLNAVRFARGEDLARLRRDQAYIGVLLDDLVTKTPREPYRMFTSRAEFRLSLRADNADARLTPLGRDLGLVADRRWALYNNRRAARAALHDHLRRAKVDGQRLGDHARRPGFDAPALLAALNGDPLPPLARDRGVVTTVLADLQYQGMLSRQDRDAQRLRDEEAVHLPAALDYAALPGLRKEAALVLDRFRPATLGQAGRLAGVNPTDLMVVSIHCARIRGASAKESA